MKKALILIVISAFLVTMLIGVSCKESSETVVEEQEVEEAVVEESVTNEEETEEEILEDITLRWAVIPFTQNEIDQVQEIADIYTEKNPNVTVEIESIAAEEYITKFLTLLAAKDLPDLFFSHSGWTEQFIRDGIALDLKPYLESGDYPVKYDDIDPAMMNVCTASTGEVSLISRAMDVYVMFYNKAMFDEAGLDYPTDDWTYDDMVEYAKTLTKETEDGMQYGFVFDVNSIQQAIMGAGSEGFDVGNLSADGTEYNFNSPEAVKGFSYWLNGMTEGYAMPIEAVGEAGGFQMAFALGKAAMVPMARWGVPICRDNLTDDWDVVLMPKGSGGGRMVNGGTAGYAVASTTKNPEAAVDLLLSIYSEDGMNVLTSNYSTVPPVTTLYDSEIWRGLPGPPYNNDAFVDASKDMVIFPRDPWFREDNLNVVFKNAIDNFLLGMDLQEALDMAVQEFNTNLSDLKADY